MSLMTGEAHSKPLRRGFGLDDRHTARTVGATKEVAPDEAATAKGIRWPVSKIYSTYETLKVSARTQERSSAAEIQLSNFSMCLCWDF